MAEGQVAPLLIHDRPR